MAPDPALRVKGRDRVSTDKAASGMKTVVKAAAAKVAASGDDVTRLASGRLYEKVVPIPQIATYSELPFAKIERPATDRQGDTVVHGDNVEQGRNVKQDSARRSAAKKSTAAKRPGSKPAAKKARKPAAKSARKKQTAKK